MFGLGMCILQSSKAAIIPNSLLQRWNLIRADTPDDHYLGVVLTDCIVFVNYSTDLADLVSYSSCVF